MEGACREYAAVEEEDGEFGGGHCQVIEYLADIEGLV